MEILPKQCKILQIEQNWQEKWEKMKIYHFDWKDQTRPIYTIDTPPPYPSGDFHMGNVLNWTYFDMVARYKRMQGYNVHFPQGWDCHGLPTEVETEEEHQIKKTDIPSAEFVKLCKQFVNKYIRVMKNAVKRLGCSIDWTTEYKTMDPDYWKRTQLSFLLLLQKGLIYRGTHPINWCPSCETAIADAEVEHETKTGTLYYIKFKLDENTYLPVATTRPELLPACVTVAVHPTDERYKEHVGSTVHVPVTNHHVQIIHDEIVDPQFGTGVVMICSYGDKADVKTIAQYKLPVKICINDKGEMNENAGKYAGMTITDAKERIVNDLEKAHLLEKTEAIQQEVGVCWRCKTSIEILERPQWFMKTRVFTDKVQETTLQITWFPDYMKKRMVDWAKSLDWDWVISRQRIFATPIPVWYCTKCYQIIIAESHWLPIDPRIENPKINKCPKCLNHKFKPETDVLDTWFDSSITCAVHAGWPDKEDWKRLFPADLHPSGYDIIRTWAYYLMVRHLALFEEKPYKSVLINGMVLGNDGKKMSKSQGNYVATPDVFNKYGADSSRQWAANGGATGSDIPFRWPDVEYGWRFLRKLWNVARFTSLQMQDYTSNKKVELTILDQWLLSKMEQVTQNVTKAFERCQFNVAISAIRNFTWHELCDLYLEAIKHRLYQPDIYGLQKKRATQYTLYTAIYRVLQLLAPISPHLTEEIYQRMYAPTEQFPSIHVSPWPTVITDRINLETERQGDLIIATIKEIRREKAEMKASLNTPITKLHLFTDVKETAQILEEAKADIAGTCKITKIQISNEKRVGRNVEGYPHIQFSTEY